MCLRLAVVVAEVLATSWLIITTSTTSTVVETSNSISVNPETAGVGRGVGMDGMH